jgi:hypothetical protein
MHPAEHVRVLPGPHMLAAAASAQTQRRNVRCLRGSVDANFMAPAAQVAEYYGGITGLQLPLWHQK